MKIDIEEIKKLTIEPGQVLFIKIGPEASMDDQDQLLKYLGNLGMKAIVHRLDFELTSVKDKNASNN